MMTLTMCVAVDYYDDDGGGGGGDVVICCIQPVAGDKKAGKRPTPSFLREFLRCPREPPSVS